VTSWLIVEKGVDDSKRQPEEAFFSNYLRVPKARGKKVQAVAQLY
jgi:hypothetical protein